MLKGTVIIYRVYLQKMECWKRCDFFLPFHYSTITSFLFWNYSLNPPGKCAMPSF